MNLFIDTNIYLTFYHFTNDDLEELKKLLTAIKGKKIKLFLPEQIINEFKRNRESKIAEALSILDEQKIPDRFPQLIKDYPEYEDLIASREKFTTSKNLLLAKLKEDINNKSLRADEIINNLFIEAEKIPITTSIMQKAKDRFDTGNPPGKKSSYGDAINWESLLKQFPEGEDLHIVGRDSDYISPLDKNAISAYLKDEWYEQKKSNVELYLSLSEFFRKQFPEIKLASEMEKEIAISDLIEASNFAATHWAISRLNQYTDFTDSEVKQILKAGTLNNQIYGIGTDEDVKDFFSHLIKERGDLMTDEDDMLMLKHYYITDDEEEIEPPF
jgi:hypothetical protein